VAPAPAASTRIVGRIQDVAFIRGTSEGVPDARFEKRST
jgi:hypothetical protein